MRRTRTPPGPRRHGGGGARAGSRWPFSCRSSCSPSSPSASSLTTCSWTPRARPAAAAAADPLRPQEGPGGLRHPERMDGAEVHIDVGAELWLFLALRDRGRRLRTVHDGTSSLGHVIESLGVPLPEVGRLIVNGRVAVPPYRPRDGGMVPAQP